VFVDRVRVNLQAGSGGAGVVSFVRAKGKPLGKPIGGSGGRGGDVIIEASPHRATLLDYRHHPHHAAGDGAHGQGELRHGKQGADLILPVPLGTMVFDDEGTLLADLVAPGHRVTVRTGGRGGRGNAAFVSPQLKAPNVAEQGEYGQRSWFTLELKLMADAALVGFPNAGKSTLISRVSAAKPKIADYPFTTLEPNLGVVAFDEREFVLADIPGLIEGAAEGKGLGHEFLRHVERASVLVVLLDPSIAQPEPPARQLEILLSELGRFNPELLERPRVVALNKSDLGPEADLLEGLPELHRISCLTGEGVTSLLHEIADLVDAVARSAPEREGFVLHRPLGAGFSVHRLDGMWLIDGVAAERAVRFSDLTNPQAADLAARRLARLGIDDALARAGAQAGDIVKIGDLEFEYTPSWSEEE
jgi:GTPase